MMHMRTMDDQRTPIATETIEAFRAAFRGQLIDETDPDYDEARRVWNGLIDKRPTLIARCSGLADVVAAVGFARANGLLTSVRAGGRGRDGIRQTQRPLHAQLRQLLDRSSVDRTVVDWTRAQVAASQPFAAGGLYLNFPGVGENTEDLVHEAYGPNHARLVEIKRRYDPDNLFRVNQNIRP